MRDNRKAWGRSAALLLAVAAGMAVGACEKQVREAKSPDETESADAAPAVASGGAADVSAEPTTAAASLGAAKTKPAAETRPTLALLLIDGRVAQFPPTKLQLGSATGDGIAAELFSDLPKSALRKYDGHEMCLEMKLAGGDGPQKIDGAVWQFKAADSGKSGSVNGIFLNGQATHLQPVHVMVRFERREAGMYAVLMGQFRAFEDGAPEGLAPFVKVEGELPVEIVQKQ